MVLEELGGRIAGALAQLSTTSVIDEKVLNDVLKEIATALLQADVNVKHVAKLREEVKKKVKLDDVAAGLNKRKIIEAAVFDGLCSMLDASGGKGPAGTTAGADKKAAKPSSGSFEIKKGRPNIVMFVGLQGAGKTTTCTKYAYHYKKKGFKPALVCADTFRAGAFDQLKQNATKANVPYYGSYSETDPAVIAQQGVDKFKDAGMDLIIVDTSGRHKQQEALFEEMRQVAAAVTPDVVIFVMDGSIGQAAFDQAKAFKDAVEVGQVIITKLDGHAKGGGALSAVAATQSPITFIGTGEHMDEFQSFDTKAFVSRLLGKGDLKSLRQTIESVIPDKEDKDELMETISKGNFTLRILYDQLQNIMKLGPVSSVMSMIPGFSNLALGKGHEQESQARLKRFLTIMDSMTDKELDSNDIKLLQDNNRILRVAKGSGTNPQYVLELLEEFKRLKMVVSGMGGKGGIKGMPRNLKGMNPHNMQLNMQQMSRMLPPQLLKQMGGPQALQSIMKAMEGKM